MSPAIETAGARVHQGAGPIYLTIGAGVERVVACKRGRSAVGLDANSIVCGSSCSRLQLAGRPIELDIESFVEISSTDGNRLRNGRGKSSARVAVQTDEVAPVWTQRLGVGVEHLASACTVRPARHRRLRVLIASRRGYEVDGVTGCGPPCYYIRVIVVIVKLDVALGKVVRTRTRWKYMRFEAAVSQAWCRPQREANRGVSEPS